MIAEVDYATARADELKRQAGCALLLVICGQRIPFETANEASGIVREMAEQSGLGAREIGSRFAVVDRAGVEVGHVSYNGRVWQGVGASAVCVFPVNVSEVQS